MSCGPLTHVLIIFRCEKNIYFYSRNFSHGEVKEMVHFYEEFGLGNTEKNKGKIIRKIVNNNQKVYFWRNPKKMSNLLKMPRISWLHPWHHQKRGEKGGNTHGRAEKDRLPWGQEFKCCCWNFDNCISWFVMSSKSIRFDKNDVFQLFVQFHHIVYPHQIMRAIYNFLTNGKINNNLSTTILSSSTVTPVVKKRGRPKADAIEMFWHSKESTNMSMNF